MKQDGFWIQFQSHEGDNTAKIGEVIHTFEILTSGVKMRETSQLVGWT